MKIFGHLDILHLDIYDNILTPPDTIIIIVGVQSLYYITKVEACCIISLASVLLKDTK